MKILIVDDREDNRALLQSKLASRGFACEEAVNGAEGLAKLRRGPYAAVISDLLMPVMDGFQLTHAIKSSEHLRRIPVIIYTSTYTDRRDEALARNLGANAFILKPAPDDVFFAAVDKALAAGTGEVPVPPTLPPDEVQYLRSYTERLIQKLEDKVEEAARANQQLSTLNAELEAKVAAATAELREANNELEAYVNSVTHDLRAPLRTIEGYSEMLLEDDAMPVDERKRLLTRIAHSAARTQRFVQDLLDYSQLKQKDVPLRPVALDAVVRHAAESAVSLDHAAPPRIEVLGTLPPVLAYEPVLAQALENLVSNAVKFVAPGVQPHVRISAERQGSDVRVMVADNGVGIPTQDHGRVFQIFERLHPGQRFPGSGVGLAMVKRAVQKMGGRLGFESEPGSGSRFWLELPAAESKNAD